METWQVFAASILTSTVVSTSLTLFVTWARDQWKDRRDKRSDAQEVARSLEAFVRRCAQTSIDADEAKPAARENALVDISLPTWDLPGIAWKLWDHELVDQVKSFQTTVTNAQHAMAREWDASGLDEPMDYLHLIEKKSVTLAETATDLAEKVRLAFHLSTSQAEIENRLAQVTLKKTKVFHADRDARLWAKHNRELDQASDEARRQASATPDPASLTNPS